MNIGHFQAPHTAKEHIFEQKYVQIFADKDYTFPKT